MGGGGGVEGGRRMARGKGRGGSREREIDRESGVAGKKRERRAVGTQLELKSIRTIQQGLSL